MRTHVAVVAAAALIASGCSDSSAPTRVRPTINLIGGFGLTDTVSATAASALVVEVHDSSGALATQGTVVRFTGAPTPATTGEMLVQGVASTSYGNSADAATGADGRATIKVQFGRVAGLARLAVSVPALGVEDTARYTIRPGNADGVSLAPPDTAMYVGRTLTLRARVTDRFGNERTGDPITYTPSASGISATSGVVTATEFGRYTLTGSIGPASATLSVSVVPQGRLTAVRATSGTSLRIIAIDLDGSNYRDLTSVSDGGIGPRPRWLPGTNTIVYSHYDGTRQQLRTVDQDGRVAAFLPNPPATMTNQAEASPSVAAPVVYFSAYDSRCGISSGSYCLHRSAPDGSNVEMLGPLVVPNVVTSRPSGSPDGSKVAFVTFGGVTRVFDFTTKTVSSWTIDGSFPSWSPDGRSIVVTQSGFGPLRIMNADGSNVRTIPTGTRYYRDSAVNWSADSKWLIADSFAGTLDVVNVESGQVLPLPFTLTYGPGSLK